MLVRHSLEERLQTWRAKIMGLTYVSILVGITLPIATGVPLAAVEQLISDTNQIFELSCRVSTGGVFKIENMKWKQLQLANRGPFVLRKLDPHDTIYTAEQKTEIRACLMLLEFDGLSNVLEETVREEGLIGYKPTGGCYLVEGFEKDVSLVSCKETWSHFPPEPRRLRKINCWDGQYEFEPNGRFSWSTVGNFWSGDEERFLEGVTLALGVCDGPELLE